MNEQNHVRADEPASPPPASDMPAAADAAVSVNRDELRVQRLEDLEERALLEPDPVLANIGVQTADMSNMARLLGRSIIQELESGGSASMPSTTVLGAVRTYDRLVGRIERNENLVIRLTKLRDADAEKLNIGPLEAFRATMGLDMGQAKF